jgi:hypothetical protein
VQTADASGVGSIGRLRLRLRTLRHPVVICQPSERSVAFPQREEPRGQQQQQHQAWRQPCLKRRRGNYLSMLGRSVGRLADGSRQRRTAPSVCMLPNR